MSETTLNESIIKIRVALQETKCKKSGKNKFAGFEYFELSDFLPTLNKLMLAEKINDHFDITEDTATLTLIKGTERETYTIPFVRYDTPMNNQGKPSMQDVQYLGALNTYYKRYLYLNAFGITDGEIIDAMDNTQAQAPAKKQAPKQTPDNDVPRATEGQLKIIGNLPEESKASILRNYKVEKLEDLDIDTADKIVKYIKKLEQNNENKAN